MTPAGIPGVDVSSRQPSARTAWPAIAASGVRWGMVRAAEGTTPDEAYQTHRDAARAVGLATGAYQFARARHPAGDEADLFLQQLGDDPLALPPTLDLERGGAADQLPPSALLDWVHAWLERVGEATGVRPWLYAGPGFVAQALPASHDLGGWPLWCAAYTEQLLLPRGWNSAAAWQYSGTGRVPGYPGDADRSVYLGSADELARAAGAPLPGDPPCPT